MSHDLSFSGEGYISRWIYCISRSANVYFSREMQKYGLGSGHFFFLRVLMSKEGISQNELSDILGVDKATTAKAMSKLTEAGYVKREIDSLDTRVYKLFLTDNGKKIGQKLRKLGSELEEILTEGFSGDEKQQLLSLLERAATNAKKAK
ncbi:transcriptional regulator, MarR family protein [Mesotoga sp. HF07.pep.5.2.highcov]|jgi:DNA-binding MarR family transcriptional regulator|uniref:MarR family winged helix-turn-helix transcriptional regulator n=1 Tax=Mesotoga TaxID=1184396 RepID=UPI0002C91D58|nr:MULTISPECIES: MarR family winged helix-turn-helix transcriptional regulator [Mesotoga]MCP5457724.1 winged helix-turn-helix transcriptional regulator [Thermotogota bacterium]CCU85223.1 Transcriptional regulator, MarR family [Mesotoga infera]RLL89141.1 transcriptional regulator, MarR family protein [Mesotoga sp. H07pep.5.4]RLL92610.1 transcriptional regulator, MarR family protein [Mesotoga sp. HF07.pep.5.2.highcov]HNQ71007.1 MarR family winged helix-turn-helix transcriptional regulator [Mesot